MLLPPPAGSADAAARDQSVPLAPSAIPQSSVSRLAPDQAVRSYFQFVSQQRYDVTWQMLTDAFKQKFNCCAPNYNYSGYVDWWNSVNNVEFGQVQTVSQSGDRAVVYAELYYVMNTGDRSGMDNTPYIALVYDSTSGSWRFDDKRANSVLRRTAMRPTNLISATTARSSCLRCRSPRRNAPHRPSTFCRRRSCRPRPRPG